MAIPINEELVRSLIRRRFGSVDNLIVEWEHRVASKGQRRGVHRDRTTVYRWLSTGLPSQTDDIFGFAAVLDVDPVALLSIDQRYVHEQFGRERRWFRLNRRRATYLAPLWPIYAAEDGWPNQALAEAFFGRHWHVTDFAHDPTIITNVYAAIVLENRDPHDLAIPKTYHIAYRRAGVSDRMWRPFGTVIGFETEIVLLSESGIYQRIERDGPQVVFESYFGPGQAEFRIASIHAFSLTLEVPSTGRHCVRFSA